MHKLVRPEAPPCLCEQCMAWTEEFVAARRANPAHGFTWRSPGCYDEIRARLLAMSLRHCAFCDGLLGTQSRKTVEHFRPKSVFPEQAYAWDNLYPCCDVCQAAKRESFDEALLRPDSGDYRFDAYFMVNFRTGELEPHPGACDAARQRAAVTIGLYGLNTPERNHDRRRVLAHFGRDPQPCLDDYPYRFALAPMPEA